MNDRTMIEKIFFKMLPVQVMIVAMGSVNSIVDGAVAGRYIDVSAVGVIGLFGSVILGINAVSSVLLGGSAVLCGRFMGRGDLEKTRNVFSLNLAVIGGLGAALSLFCLFFPGVVAKICGADAVLMDSLTAYVRGFAPGILPMMLGQQLAAFLQMERQSRRNYAGIVCMVVFNIALDILLVAVFDMGVTGLALSTAACNWIYFLVLLPYYFTEKAQMRFRLKGTDVHMLAEIVKIGFPGALLVFCLSLRNLVLNRIILRYAGQDGMAAKGALEMVGSLFIAFCLGGGATIRMLASIFMGKEDRDSIKALIRLSLTKLMALTLAITAAVIVFSGPVARIFITDTASTAYLYTKQYFVIYGASIPLILVVQIQTNYLQAGGHHLCVDISSVIDGFVSVIVPALILAPLMGALGIWLATPVGIVLTALIYPVYAWIVNGHFPKDTDERLLFQPGFGVEEKDRLVFTLHDVDEVVRMSEQVQDFCLDHGFGKSTSFYSALCLEEMAGNVTTHGFSKDDKMHHVEAKAVCKDDQLILRIKDDCIPFDPLERAKQMDPEDPAKNIGIRLVVKLADEVTYQNLLGLNVFTVKLKDQKKA